MRKVGIIGCGAIGTIVSGAVEKGLVKCGELILYDRNIERAEKLRSSLHVPVTVVKSLDEMIRLKPAVIVEARARRHSKPLGIT